MYISTLGRLEVRWNKVMSITDLVLVKKNMLKYAYAVKALTGVGRRCLRAFCCAA